MLNLDDRFALSQSDALISVAYNSYCKFLLKTCFMKQGPRVDSTVMCRGGGGQFQGSDLYYDSSSFKKKYNIHQNDYKISLQ